MSEHLTPSLADILSASALVVSIGAAIVSWRAARTSNSFQSRLVSIEGTRERDRLTEMRSAAVLAEVHVSADRTWQLRVRNEGPAEAREVLVLLDDQPLYQSYRAHAKHATPFHLGPGGRRDFTLAVHVGSSTVFDVELRWIDGNSENNVWRSRL